MKKSTLLYLGATALTLSVIINFNREYFAEFAIFSLIFSIPIFYIFRLFFKAVGAFFEKKIWEGIKFLLKTCGFGVLVFLLYILTLATIRGQAITPNHFRTNTLTGRCNFGGYNSARVQDPWYYKEGCDLSKEKLIPLINAIKDTRDVSVVICKQYCDEGFMGYSDFVSEGGFCVRKNEITGTSTSASMSCEYLVDCPSIKCSDMKPLGSPLTPEEKAIMKNASSSSNSLLDFFKNSH